MMKKLFVLLVCVSFGTLVYSQSEINISGNASLPLGKFDNDAGLGFGLSVGYSYKINHSIIGIDYFFESFEYNFIDRYSLNAGIIKYNYLLFSENSKINPFIGTGIGLFYYNYKIFTSSPKGYSLGVSPEIGVRYIFNENISSVFRINYSYLFNDQYNGLVFCGINVGIIYSL